jgi:predicted amidohydrolase
MSRPLPLALVQAAGRAPGDLKGFAEHVEQVARTYPQSRLLVYPELHLAGDDLDPRRTEQQVADSAEPLDGPRHEFLAQLAGDLGVWLVPGSVSELGEDGRVYNTALVYSPEGRRAAAYRKIFPWRPYETCSSGREFVVFEMPGHGRVGLSVCYDAWFPEHTRQLAWLGAELVLNLVKTPTVDRAQETVIARANAIVNQVFVASVNAGTPSGLGRSLLVDPEGRVRVEAVSELPSVLTDVIDLDAVTTVRRFGTAGLNRVWDQYQHGHDEGPVPLPMYGGRIDPATWRGSTSA